VRLVHLAQRGSDTQRPLHLQCAVNVCELVTLDAVQQDAGLGPNGGLVYAMEYVAANLDWLDERLKPLLASGTYLLVDCPGQVELFNVHDALFKVVSFLTDKLHIRCALEHVDRSTLLTAPPPNGRLTCALPLCAMRFSAQVDGGAPGGQPPVR
jgi:hypothetical protein